MIFDLHGSTVLQPTRYKLGEACNILDLILTNEEGMVSKLNFLPGLGNSDHVVLKFEVSCYSTHRGPDVPRHDFGRANFTKLNTELQKVNWEAMHELHINDSYDFFKTSLSAAVEASIPRAQPRQRKKNLYINGKANQLKKRKGALWYQFTRSRDPVDYARYKRCRNELRTLTRNLRRDFEQQLAGNIKKNPKAFWQYSNSRLKTKAAIGDLLDQSGTAQTQDSAKADILNEYFCSVFTSEDVNIPEPQWQPVSSSIDDVEISVASVNEKLKSVKVASSPGPDGIHPRILSEAAGTISAPLASFFRKSIDQSSIPQDWKVASVVPIFKKGERKLPSNYRPISLTALPCKIMESLIRDQLMEYFISGDLLSQHQHGFRPNRSCTTQLLEVLDDWSRSIEEGSSVDVIYLDFCKAFDSVPHERLLKKLEAYGVTGRLLKWIRAFLSDRKQRVVVRGCQSKWASVTSGVPQGSVLGPLLFLVYINDIPDIVNSSIKIFADDTKVYRSIGSPSDTAELQCDIDALSNWSEQWQLSFNEAKCTTLHVGSGNPEHSYTMRGIPLTSTSAERDLGVYIDPELKFRKQASSAVSKATQIMSLIRRSFANITEHTLPLLFKTLVRPHLEYGNIIWGPFNRADEKLVERVQRRATKMVESIRNKPYPERLRHLKLPSMYHRRRRGDMICIYQMLHSGLDIDPDKFVTPASSRENRGHPWKLFKPHAKSRVRRHALNIRAINDWNSLPSSVVQASSLNAFKSRLDRHWTHTMYQIPTHHE